LEFRCKRNDLIRKMSLYEKHQVKEYWIVHPIDQIVMVYRLNNGKYERPDVYANDRIIPSNVIQGLEIDLKEVFK
jgi:Uma2 family endonuclease